MFALYSTQDESRSNIKIERRFMLFSFFLVLLSILKVSK